MMSRHFDSGVSRAASNFAVDDSGSESCTTRGLGFASEAVFLPSGVAFGCRPKLGLARPSLADAGGVCSNSTRSGPAFESFRPGSRFEPLPVAGLTSWCSAELRRSMAPV